jgi:hypothetical protein
MLEYRHYQRPPVPGEFASWLMIIVEKSFVVTSPRMLFREEQG